MWFFNKLMMMRMMMMKHDCRYGGAMAWMARYVRTAGLKEMRSCYCHSQTSRWYLYLYLKLKYLYWYWYLKLCTCRHAKNHSESVTIFQQRNVCQYMRL